VQQEDDMNLGRRRFVQGMASTGALLAFSPSALAMRDRVEPAVLTGDRFDLVIEETAVNVTGRKRMATAVNGSVPAPTLRFREGDTVTIKVTNRLSEDTSIHWHGIRLPADMDGVPGLSFRGIRPGETFTYRFPIVQTGTYWYHSHSGGQEQTGLYGPLILEPRAKEPYGYDREYVVVLSDWSDEDPRTIMSNLKQQSNYYNFHQRTVGTFFSDVRRQGWGPTIADRLRWGRMRMDPTDIMDVTGATYTFLINGQPPAANWTALFKAGETVRLRFINSAAMSTFDVRIPDLPLRIVQADGTDIEPVEVDEFRIGVAETYDVLVAPQAERAYTIFAQTQDRSGYARATLAPQLGLRAVIPPMDPRPMRTMADMGMGEMNDTSGTKGMSGMDMSKPGTPHGSMPGMDHPALPGKEGMTMAGAKPPTVNASGVDVKTMRRSPWVTSIYMAPKDRLAEAGDGLDGNGRRVLTYAQLKTFRPTAASRSGAVQQEIEFHLTGNMERFVWGFDGKKFSEAPPVRVKLGQHVRFVLINDTMMEHPIHLHGFLFAVENGQGDRLPLKHTINVKPGERMSVVYTADTPGHWAFHCHLLFHQQTSMFRTVVVA
jgi:CopA family copper-resistance protein